MRDDGARDSDGLHPSIFVSAISLLFFVSANWTFAQDVEDDTADDEIEATEEIVVTGSRLKRDTYSSIAPLQVITGQVSREVGLIDAGEILQQSTASSGQQIDLTFQGFVLDNGPGSSTINLRGLGEARTLVLLNGRRLAPAGVEGAPFAADLNLIPASLVQQYDLLLDGASSVYGSDAVAGVTNIILRKDFDGLEFEAFTNVPEQGAGVEHTLSLIWGKNTDRGFIGVGAEYTDIEAVTLADRSWTSQCDRHMEIDEYGQVRTTGLFEQVNYNMRPNDCKSALSAGWISLGAFPRTIGSGFGSVFYTPGFSNSGIPNFSDWNQFAPIDVDGDGMNDVDFADYALESSQQEAHLFPDLSRTSVMAYGEYTMAGEMNITPYFEAMYSERDFFADSGAGQLFPVVPALNPFSVCNPGGLNGVDCGLAFDSMMNNPNYIAGFTAVNGDPPSFFGLGNDGPSGPILTQPVVSVDGDRTLNTAKVEQIRAVLGMRGDLPQLNVGPLNNFTFDVAAIYATSEGASSRPGVRGDRLDVSLGWYSSTNTPCEVDLPFHPRTGQLASDLAADAVTGCVPVNMFAQSLNDGIVGDFATAEERNFLFDTRDFDTEYTQTIFSGYLTGNIFELPAGSVSAGIGFEHREDEIESIPDAVARDGLFFGFFSDGGATGEKYTREFFGEIELPLLAGMAAAEELTLNLSARHTEDEFYGSAWTYSYKLGYRPVNSLLLRATLGTSYRAPNLRENFLQNQSGFLNIFDPCGIPEGALDPLGGGYNPALDTRDPEILANCVAQGVDPTTLNFNGQNIYSVEIARGGALDLFEEESESWSAGFAWEQPFFEGFDLTIGSTYYEIEIDNAIIEPSGQFIVNDCYARPTQDSPFCGRISRDPIDLRLDLLSAGFINRDNETVRGVDINVAYDQSISIFERPIDLGVDLMLNKSFEASETFLDDNGVPTYDDDQGEFGHPDWRGQLAVRADVGDFRLTWSARYLGSVEQDAAGIDEFSNAIDGASDTCLGPAAGDVNCRDIGYANDYFVHSASVYFYGDIWTFGGGVRNVFNEAPPLVDGNEVFAVNNAPLGYGYDLNGRVYFFNVAASFGGSL
ncbi:MAG: TonB-dependent receptor [Woeseia sp.]